MIKKLPQFIKLAPDGVYELYLDHTLLSSARMCEARFELDHVKLYRPKELPWALDFGTLFHSCMEYYYHQLMQDSLVLRELLEFGANLWRSGNFDKYQALPQYKAVGGFPGFIALLTLYHEYYSKSPDNLKPVALEIAFGKNKEVPLLTDPTIYKYAPFRLYLAGRMDYIFDDGRRIGPMDHKTFSMAGKNPMTTYEVQEGMTGYIYAMQFIYKQLCETHPEIDLTRDTNVLWLNFILTKSEGELNKRFQRVPLYKTPEQLEDWRLRQISTAAKIYQILIEGRPPDYNAGVCCNYWHSQCCYQQVHRLSNKADQLYVLNNHFTQGEVWDPEK